MLRYATTSPRELDDELRHNYRPFHADVIHLGARAALDPSSLLGIEAIAHP